VTPQTPPTLLLHSIDDGPVPIENSRSMLAALQKAGVASALYEYPLGGHGWGYWPDRKNAHTDGWLERTYAWLKAQGFSS